MILVRTNHPCLRVGYHIGPARRCLVLSLQRVVVPSPRDVKPLSLDIWWRVDRLGTCGVVLSCQTFNVAASRGPDSGGAYPVLEAPGHSPPSLVMRLGHN
jgi:hypothetical protein